MHYARFGTGTVYGKTWDNYGNSPEALASKRAIALANDPLYLKKKAHDELFGALRAGVEELRVNVRECARNQAEGETLEKRRSALSKLDVNMIGIVGARHAYERHTDKTGEEPKRILDDLTRRTKEGADILSNAFPSPLTKRNWCFDVDEGDGDSTPDPDRDAGVDLNFESMSIDQPDPIEPMSIDPQRSTNRPVARRFKVAKVGVP
jgi:hypothetical protein